MENISKLLVDILDDAFEGAGWHGPHNLINTIGGLTLDKLVFPSPHEGYCIWQIVLHCAYTKWNARKVLIGDRAEAFDRSPADFPSLPTVRSMETWRKDLALLNVQHAELRQVVRDFPSELLWKNATGQEKDQANVKYIYGVAAHDIYHTAQIRNMGIPGL